MTSIKAHLVIKQQGKDYVTYPGLLDAAHQAGLLSIETEIVQIPTSENGMVAICRVMVRLAADGGQVRTFTGIGDAEPGNVNRMMVPHLLRMSETRAKARALRDSVNVSEALLDDDIPDDAPPPPPPARPATRPAGTAPRPAPAGPAPPLISGLAPPDDDLAGVPDGDGIGASDSYVDSLGYPHQSAAPATPDLPDRPAPSDPPTLAQLRELKALAAVLGHLLVQPRTASAAVDLLAVWREEQMQHSPRAVVANAATAARPGSAPRSQSPREHYDALAALAKQHGHDAAVISIAIDAPDNFIREAYRALRRELVKAGVLRAPGPGAAGAAEAAAAPATAQANVSSPATPAQVETIGKLTTALGKKVATDGLTRAQASEWITRLSEERYGQNRRAASV